jgi:hypothetical protein
MRIDSNKKSLGLLLVYILAFLCFVFDLISPSIKGELGQLPPFSPALIVVLLFVWYRGPSNFMYDAEGEVLNFTTRNPHLHQLSNSVFEHHSEFPKRKLISFEISKSPFRRHLILKINGKSSTKVEKFSISYLTSKELRKLKSSLKKVVAANNQENG